MWYIITQVWYKAYGIDFQILTDLILFLIKIWPIGFQGTLQTSNPGFKRGKFHLP